MAAKKRPQLDKMSPKGTDRFSTKPLGFGNYTNVDGKNALRAYGITEWQKTLKNITVKGLLPQNKRGGK